MDSTTEENMPLPPQESRTSRSGHGGTIVPDSPASLSSDGPTDSCSARLSAEDAIAKATEEGMATGFVKPGPSSYKKRKRGSVERLHASAESEIEPNTETITLGSGSEGGSEGGSGESYIDESGIKKRGPGRPQTTGLYAGRAEAKKQLADQEERLMRIKQEREMRQLTTEEFYRRCGFDIEEAIDKMRRNPTEDLTNRARELQRVVVNAAKISKNIKGTVRKDLTDSALITSACVEVLRARIGEGPDTDAVVQIRELEDKVKTRTKERDTALEKVRSLEKALQEKGEALDRIEKLEKAIAEKRSPGKDRILRSNRANRILDSSSEEESMPLRKKPRKKSKSVSPKKGTSMDVAGSAKDGEGGDAALADLIPPYGVDDPRMFGNDPPVCRPPVRGVVKILDDRMLTSNKVVLKKKATSPRVGNPTTRSAEVEKAESAVGLFEQLVPMLDKWMQGKLGALLPLSQAIRGGEKEKLAGHEPVKKKGLLKQTMMAKGENPDTPILASSVMGASTPKSENTGSGRELYSKVLGKKQKVAARKQVKERDPRAKTAPAAKQAVSQKGDASKNVSNARRNQEGAKAKRTDVPAVSGNREGKSRLPRPPRTAAITLTCPPGRYAEAMGKAREKIKLEELGIKSLRPRRGLTGSLVLEIADKDGANKAKSLRDRMQEVLEGMEGVRVTRPLKCSELRIRDILEDTSVEEIQRAIAENGGCEEDEIKVGPLQKSLNGLYSAWVRCPVAAANRMAGNGKLQIGWCTARVETLPSRPLSCFRCLELGHVQARCKSAIDRRNLCYRCGQPGHIARHCDGTPFCTACAEVGKPSAHRTGTACAQNRGTPRVRVEPEAQQGQGYENKERRVSSEKDTAVQPLATGNVTPMDTDPPSPEILGLGVMGGEEPKEQRPPRRISRRAGTEEPGVEPAPSTSAG